MKTTAKKSSKDEALREQLLALMRGGNAHVDSKQALANLPPESRGRKPEGASHTPWQLLEHMRLAQWDILEFSRNPRYESLPFPEGYWPKTEAPPDEAAWDESVKNFERDMRAMQRLVKNPETDLYKRIPWGEGQTILREAMLVADHNAYHLGQLVSVRKMLGAW